MASAKKVVGPTGHSNMEKKKRKAKEKMGRQHHRVTKCFDITKCFDTINHTILLKKLSFYGFKDHASKWFQSYLKGNKLYHVKINYLESVNFR